MKVETNKDKYSILLLNHHLSSNVIKMKLSKVLSLLNTAMEHGSTPTDSQSNRVTDNDMNELRALP